MSSAIYRLSKTDKSLKAEIQLCASKSESNRALIIQALSKNPIKLKNISTASDTKILSEILQRERLQSIDNAEYSIESSGTAMRFLTAYFAVTPGTRILTGSERMKQRPVKPLVEALTQLGASITYLGQEGYPPLKITGKALQGNEVEIDGGISSQFITALLLISPRLFNGLVIRFKGEIVSRPYINMTMKMLDHFNVSSNWEENKIIVSNQQYSAEDNEEFVIGSDWSSASYWYSMAALADEADVKLMGLKENSLQGDLVLKDLYALFGVKTTFIEGGIQLSRGLPVTGSFGFDFSDTPDLAQTMAVTAAGLRIPVLLNGLNTLKIKETDRIKALVNELGKLGITAEQNFSGSLEIRKYPDRHELKNKKYSSPLNEVETYGDHRMAMSFAPLALVYETISINDPDSVSKSYPEFWEHMKNAGFIVEELKVAAHHPL